MHEIFFIENGINWLHFSSTEKSVDKHLGNMEIGLVIYITIGNVDTCHVN